MQKSAAVAEPVASSPPDRRYLTSQCDNVNNYYYIIINTHIRGECIRKLATLRPHKPYTSPP